MRYFFLLGRIPVSITMHNFWADVDPSARQANEGHFAKNAAILAGALMLLAVPEPWPLSVRRRRLPPSS